VEIVALGYVTPDDRPELQGFDDQFEHDGHGWLFRRFHRDLPVRVTPDEMDWSINYFERWAGRLTVAAVISWIMFMALWGWFGPDEGTGKFVQNIAGLALPAVIWAGRSWIWRKATDPFMRRVPVGLGQSWIEHRQEHVAESDWGALLLPVALLAAGAYFLWPFGHANWYDAATAAVLGGAALLNIGLKLRARFL
jgi:hypothetical protein